MMILYHGSDIVVKNPEIRESDRFLDFGCGFYTTANREQADKWATKVCIRKNIETPIISVYEFDIEKAEKELLILKFETANSDWLDFVCNCRTGKQKDDYDMVFGPVADDNVYSVVKLFEEGVYDKDEALKRLKIENLYNQYLFHTEKSLNYCLFKEVI